MKSYAKLRAIHTRQKQPIATRAHAKVLDHALVLVGISLRGYSSSLHAFRCAPYHNLNDALFHACSDPRTHQDSVFEHLEQILVSYLRRCKQDGVAPQIWIPNHSSFRHWEAICDRLTLTQKHLKLASILQYLTQRYHYGGSQTLLCLSHVLKHHWMTGQTDSQDESLESWQNWLRGQPHSKIPEHASTFLYTHQESPSPIRPDIIETLHDESKTRLHNLARTLSLFVHHAPEIIPCWIDWWQQDLHYFSLFCTRPTSTKEDSSVLAAQKLEERECTIENYIADLRQKDTAYFYASLLEGHCLEGVIQNINGQTLSLLCNQTIIRAREGDSLSLRTNPQVQFRVFGSEWTDQGYLIYVRNTFGRISCSLHQKIQLTPTSMGWNFVQRQRQKISERMNNPGWIHTTEHE